MYSITFLIGTKEDAYVAAYNGAIKPLSGAYKWRETGLNPILPPLEYIALSGRPEKKRSNDLDDSLRF